MYRLRSTAAGAKLALILLRFRDDVGSGNHHADPTGRSAISILKRKANIEEVFPFLEYLFPGLDDIRRRPTSHLIKTHLPYGILPSDVTRGNGKVKFVVTLDTWLSLST